MIYYFFFVILLSLAFWEKYEPNVSVLIFFLIIIFYSFSYKIGWDYPEYSRIFKTIYEKGLHYNDTQSFISLEKGYVFHNFLISRITNNYQLFLFITDFVMVFFLFRAFKLLFEKDYLLAVVVFVVLYGNRIFISTLRQGFATIFFFNAIVCYQKQEKKYFFLFSIVAVLFHLSALLIFVIVLMDKLIKKNIIYKISSFLILILGIVQFDLIKLLVVFLPDISAFSTLQKIFFYLNNNISTRFSLIDLIQCLFCIFMFYKSKDESNIFKILILMSLTINCICPSLSILMNRLRYYFFIGYIYCIFDFLKKNDSKNHIFKFSLTCWLFGIYTMTYMINNENYSAYNPYKNYLIEIIKTSQGVFY